MTRSAYPLPRPSRSARETGLTVVEMVVSLSILAIVVAIFFSTFAVVQTAAKRQGDRSRNNDQARLAVEQLDREIRSGNVLYDPAEESDPGFMLRIYTQSNAPTRPGYTCRLWRVTDDGLLQTRYWPPQLPAQATSWRTVAEGIVNRDVTPPAAPFTLSTDPTKGYRSVDILLLVNDHYDVRAADTVRIGTSITGRNTAYGYPLNECDQLPT